MPAIVVMHHSLASAATLRQMSDRRCSSISRQRQPGSRHRVVVLAVPGVVTFDLGCAVQVFARAPGLAGDPGRYDFATCGVRRRTPTSDGFALTLNAGLDAIATADTVIVPGYVGWDRPPR
jgi:transcriptional regulator GlxA family with amidase domain